MAGNMRSDGGSSSSGSGFSSSRGESVVADYGRRKSSCGYCRRPGRTSISHGLWANRITVDDYQDLIDQGWRRSGSFLYKPDMETTCCPSYTIRLRAADFFASKEQLRVSRRMQRFLDGTLDIQKPVNLIDDPPSKDTSCCAGNEVSSSSTKELLSSNNEMNNKAEQLLNYLADEIENAIRTCKDSGEYHYDIQLPKASVKSVAQAKRKLLIKGSEDLLYSSNIALKIAAAIRCAQTCDKHQPKLSRHSAEEDELSPKYIAEKLASSLSHRAETYNLLIKACNGHINFYSTSEKSSSDGSVEIHSSSKSGAGCASKRGCLKKSTEQPQGKRRRLEILLKRSNFDPEEFALYRKYQIKVHNDTPDHVTESSYRSFLVNTPLVFVPSTGDGIVPNCGFGSFHQQYVIDGRLVAVGVIDILPRCLSSKYLFWDPDFAFLSLGKYSALQEIGWVRENQAHCLSLQYYYLGYYIHSCSKMRYKAAYRPSELLCPLRYQWVPFDIAGRLLDRKPYVVLSDFEILQNEESSPPPISHKSWKRILLTSFTKTRMMFLRMRKKKRLMLDMKAPRISRRKQ